MEVLLDDGKASPGVKFKDAELLGVPWIVVVGRGWADGVVELRNRFRRNARNLSRRGRRRHRAPFLSTVGLAATGAAGEGKRDRGRPRGPGSTGLP